ncbi:MAG TPA: hypothetical protein DEH78_03100 [Solibacterales bacterium]|nr:hypothetical protein [Bryobacterales bacterium]
MRYALFILVFATALSAESRFAVQFDKAGIKSLQRSGDKYPTEYIAPGRTLGHVVVRYKFGDAEWREFRTADPAHKHQALRPNPADSAAQHTFIYNPSGWNDYYADLELTERFRVDNDSLYWSLHFRNPTHKPIELGDIKILLPFNMERRYDKTVAYTERLVQHRFVSGHASFIYWMRPNGEGPYLLMFPVAECPPYEPSNAERDFTPAKLEYFDQDGVYIHAARSVDLASKRGGNWRQPVTSHTLSPRFSRNGRLTYAFKFRWANDYADVRRILAGEGLLDVEAVPGMTVPRNAEVRVSIRSRARIHEVAPEHPNETRIQRSGDIYLVTFQKEGENKLSVRFGKNQSAVLEFFVTQPIGELIRKRSRFLAARHQHRDPAKWYNGLYSEWDMRTKVLRSPDDTGGLLDYIVASDDPGLSKAPFIAAKNVEYPDAEEIASVEYYLKNYVWGKLQQTTDEKYAYAIYGIDNWKVNRESKPLDRNGWTEHIWRPFDYPHVVHLYWNMYRIAKFYPGLTRYLSADGYLERAYGTARAYYTVPWLVARWSTEEVGHYDELVILDLIRELRGKGWTAKADELARYWDSKVRHFIKDRPNLFLSEYPFDPTGFESHHAFARYALRQKDSPFTLQERREFLDEAIAGNIATRGWVEASYWQLGSEGSLRYMSQMGGWAVLDFGLHFAADPFPYLRLGYASLLSSWALMNTGYWYPGAENDGGAGSAFVPQAYGRSWVGIEQPRGPWPYSAEIDLGFGGAVRSAATVAANDPLFGWFAYGGRLTRGGGRFRVTLEDGVNRRFHAVTAPDRRLHAVIDRDEMQDVECAEDLSYCRFRLKNRTPAAPHETELSVEAAPAGAYEVTIDQRRTGSVEAAPGGLPIKLPIAGSPAVVEIRRVQ